MAGNATERLYLLMNRGLRSRLWSSCVDNLPTEQLRGIQTPTYLAERGNVDKGDVETKTQADDKTTAE